jgi:Pyrimidine dimer DNA glycosylase
MRLWSLHPKYLDCKGLVALWREALLAKAVLEGKTKGYKKHPQLERFNGTEHPIAAINAYLKTVYSEACRRGYCFDGTKIKKVSEKIRMLVTSGQIYFEASHLCMKLNKRDKPRAKILKAYGNIKLNPVFREHKGGIEPWEILWKK